MPEHLECSSRNNGQNGSKQGIVEFWKTEFL